MERTSQPADPAGTDKRIAIACQGGGSHTAFTAGALKRIMKEEQYNVVALSGTSGGAICALLTWYALLLDGGRKGREKAIYLLDAFWQENAAHLLWERVVNEWLVWGARWHDYVTTPAVNPNYFPPLAQDQLKRILERHVEFGRLPQMIRPTSPILFVGAVEVRSGAFKVFKNAEVTANAVLASAAIPTLFPAVRMNAHTYWDGLFSQNPPVRDLPDARPDEIWIIQVNPQKWHGETTSMGAIQDRRNELAGNLSLNQERYFIEKINDLIEKKALVGTKHKPIRMRTIEMAREDLDYASKLDRSPGFIEEMIAYGEARAGTCLKEWAQA